ncbi:hypothetical protein RHSIM_RhsimUnG0194500 [Rhododendron simsii]|uniref:Uncharacterized protein n=1 Tax=Rhododendron simsii TaxID=118357 RepID=A0A834FU99_RHOSS|nr:hypothetical protein RHSIM_RhsimUnG0194500 [Rhododendron simsii]
MAPRESQAAVSSTTNSSSRPVDQPVNDARICRIVDYCLWGLLFVCGFVVLSTCQLYFMGRYSSPKFQISSFSVSPFNTSSFPSSLLDSDWKITFLVQNPTGWYPTPTSYGQFEVSLLYSGVPISSASVSPFHDLHMEEEGVVGASMATLPVDNNIVISNIYYDASKDGTVNFTVAVNGTVRWLKLRPFRGDWHHMTVSCNNVMVGFYGINSGGRGALVGGPAECKAHVKIGFWEFPYADIMSPFVSLVAILWKALAISSLDARARAVWDVEKTLGVDYDGEEEDAIRRIAQMEEIDGERYRAMLALD